MLLRLMRAIISRIALQIFRVSVVRRRSTITSLKSGPVIFAANHVSFLDGVLIALASPIPLAFTSETLYSKEKLSTRLLFNALSLVGYGWVIRLDRFSPIGLRCVLRQLSIGRSVMIFPEGRIAAADEISVEMPGLSWLAERSGAPVVRLHIAGAERSRIFARGGDLWWPAITLDF